MYFTQRVPSRKFVAFALLGCMTLLAIYVVARPEASAAVTSIRHLGPSEAKAIFGGGDCLVEATPPCPAPTGTCEGGGCFYAEGWPGMWCSNSSGKVANEPNYNGVQGNSNAGANEPEDIGLFECNELCRCDISCDYNVISASWVCYPQNMGCDGADPVMEQDPADDDCRYAGVRNGLSLIAAMNGIEF